MRRMPALVESARQRAGAAARWAGAYWPGRRTVVMTAGMVALFLLAGAEAASADDGSGERGGILAPLNVMSSEGAPLDSYDLRSDPGGATDLRSHACNLLIGAGFSLVRLVIGLVCWICQWVFTLPVVSTLIDTADRLNDKFFMLLSYDIRLYSLFLAAGFAFGVILMQRGKVGRGAGELLLTVVFCTVVLMPSLSPHSILGPQGPVAQTQQAAHEVGQMTASINGTDTGCTSDKDKNDPSCPMRVVLTRTLVVQPYQLLQYGQIPAKNSWLADVHDRWIHGKLKGDKGNCDNVLPLPGSDAICDSGKNDWEALKSEFKDHGAEGQQVYDFAVNSDWDRVGGVGLVLLAALIVAVVVMSMALVHIGSQFADVIAASMTSPALIWAMLPGGSRAAAWQWTGVFMTGMVTEFAVSMALPMFALGADGILSSPQQTVMIERLIILDFFALTILIFHRRILAAAGRVGDRFAARMRYARIGGSSISGEDSRLGLAMSQAMGTLAPGGGYAGGGAGLGFGFGGSPAHAAMMRKAGIAQGLAALGDPGLGPMSAGTMALGAAGELRRGMSTLALPARAAHQLVIGNPLPPDKLAKRLKPTGGSGGPMVVDPETGEVLHDPKNETTPFGHTLHNALLRTRVGRLAIRAGQAGKLGFDVTVGLPATWERLNRANDRMWNKVDKQVAHYTQVAKDWWGDEKAGAKDWGQDVATAGKIATGGYNTVKSGYNYLYYATATTARVYGPDLAAAPLAASAHLLHGRDVTDTARGFPARPPHTRAGMDWERTSEGTLAADRPPLTWTTDKPTPGPGHSRPSPADLNGALGPGSFPETNPVVVEDGMVINPRTGEILSMEAPPEMAPDALRRVSPSVLREPSGTPLEALRMRRTIGYSAPDGTDRGEQE
ncbi:hypothetical protein AB0A71_31250 [Kitasatospora aureofaciens]|uniref:hypothetical protein n=1 Tax=Kitasatospora aureofaciens TaxID=1894 RepID=UPI0033F7BE7F